MNAHKNSRANQNPRLLTKQNLGGSLDWWGSQGKVNSCFLGNMLKNNAGLQESILSGYHMTMGFGPFELPTRGLLQKGRDHSLGWTA